MFRKKDGGISVVAKKRSAIGTFFDNHYKSYRGHLHILWHVYCSARIQLELITF
jgi:hypothetical protein